MILSLACCLLFWNIASVSLLQANNCVEEKEWIDILTKICQTNANRLKRYHPSAYINGHWLWWVQYSQRQFDTSTACWGCKGVWRLDKISTASHPRRLESSAALLWEPQILQTTGSICCRQCNEMCTFDSYLHWTHWRDRMSENVCKVFYCA